jgi:beta-lactamase class A
MRNSCLLLLGLVVAMPSVMYGQNPAPLDGALRELLGPDTARVSVVYLDRLHRTSLALGGDRRLHAASTMKVPVLIELARRVAAGEFRWDDTLVVRNQFASIVDGSPYRLDPADDSDSSLYLREGAGVTLRELAHRMTARSSNLATNLLIALLDPRRVQATARGLGADSIMVRRGVEDGKAFAQGLNNTTTARDLAVLLDAIAEGRAAGAESEAVVEMLLAQEFNESIPAGLPPGTKVAHKTGWITGIMHDAAIIYPPGRRPFVLVVLTSGFEQTEEARARIAAVARTVYAWAMTRPDPRE